MSEQKSRTVNHSEAMVIARAKSTGAGRRLVGGEWLFSHDELVRFHDLLIATGMSEAATLCEGEAAEYLRNVWPPHEPPQPAEATECRYCDEVMKERDDYHEWADTLAYDIERLVGVEIGEHSNLNSPWGNAHDAAEYELDKRARKPHEPNVVQKIMARLADLLDEDQFNEIESMALNAGIHPPPEPAEATGGTATVRTGAKIAELVNKYPGLGIDTFVHERDYNQAENHRRELKRQLERSAPVEPEGWRPIETAPNGKSILVAYDNGRVDFVEDEDNDYTWEPYTGPAGHGINRPTHWMPIPSAPSTKRGAQS